MAKSLRALHWQERLHPRDNRGRFAEKGGSKWLARVVDQMGAAFGDVSMGAAPGKEPRGRLQTGKGGLIDVGALSRAAPRSAPVRDAAERQARPLVGALKKGDHAKIKGEDIYGRSITMTGYVDNPTPVRVGKGTRKRDMISINVSEQPDGGGTRSRVLVSPDATAERTTPSAEMKRLEGVRAPGEKIPGGHILGPEDVADDRLGEKYTRAALERVRAKAGRSPGGERVERALLGESAKATELRDNPSQFVGRRVSFVKDGKRYEGELVAAEQVRGRFQSYPEIAVRVQGRGPVHLAPDTDVEVGPAGATPSAGRRPGGEVDRTPVKAQTGDVETPTVKPITQLVRDLADKLEKDYPRTELNGGSRAEKVASDVVKAVSAKTPPTPAAEPTYKVRRGAPFGGLIRYNLVKIDPDGTETNIGSGDDEGKLLTRMRRLQAEQGPALPSGPLEKQREKLAAKIQSYVEKRLGTKRRMSAGEEDARLKLAELEPRLARARREEKLAAERANPRRLGGMTGLDQRVVDRLVQENLANEDDANRGEKAAREAVANGTVPAAVVNATMHVTGLREKAEREEFRRLLGLPEPTDGDQVIEVDASEVRFGDFVSQRGFGVQITTLTGSGDERSAYGLGPINLEPIRLSGRVKVRRPAGASAGEQFAADVRAALGPGKGIDVGRGTTPESRIEFTKGGKIKSPRAAAPVEAVETGRTPGGGAVARPTASTTPPRSSDVLSEVATALAANPEMNRRKFAGARSELDILQLAIGDRTLSRAKAADALQRLVGSQDAQVADVARTALRRLRGDDQLTPAALKRVEAMEDRLAKLRVQLDAEESKRKSKGSTLQSVKESNLRDQINRLQHDMRKARDEGKA